MGVVGVLVVLVATGLALSHEAASDTGTTRGGGADYRFVSAPDLFNADIGNLRLRPEWDDYRRQWKKRFPNKPVPNSWNHHHRRSVNAIVRQLASEGDDALVAGDLVAGHWALDRYRLPGAKRRMVETRAFGPTDTWQQKKRALTEAADFYFRQYQRFFRSHDLRLWPAVGDHEYGDNPWTGSYLQARFKRAMIPRIQDRFHRHLVRPRMGRVTSRPHGPARQTAYATRLTDEVLLVTLDQFKLRNGRVTGTLDDQQLRWLDRTLARANQRGTDWIIVQGHLPIVPTVAIDHSSGMCYRGGTSSALWRTLVRHDVDLYLNGEVHDNSRNTVDGVTQISHGGLYGKPHDHGNTAYVVGAITGDRLTLTLKRFRVADVTKKPQIFQTARRTKVVKRKVNEPTPAVLGQLQLTADRRILSSSGVLGEYRGDQRCGYRDGKPHGNL